MKKSFGALVAAFAVVGLVAPVGSGDVARSSSISDTGPRSTNIIRRGRGVGNYVRINNRNNVRANIETVQNADSGNAKVKYNNDGGSADTGDALNDNITDGTIDIANDNETAGNTCDDCGGDATISNTGPRSYNKIVVGDDNCNRRCRNGKRIRNNNRVRVVNTTIQTAHTGNAKVVGNTTGGDATTGDADNLNDTVVDVVIDNNNAGHQSAGCDSCGGDASIDTTGPGSTNIIKVNDGCGCGGGLKVNNNNNVTFDNYTDQYAASGNAKVKHNTTGGSATTGNASNSNSTSLSAGITNSN